MNDTVLPELPSYLFEPTLQGVLSLVLTVLLPLGAALVMKRSMGTAAKAIVLLALSGVKAFVEAWIDASNNGAAFNAWTVAYAIVINFGLAVVAYYGFWKGTAVQQNALNGGIVKDGAHRAPE